MPIGPEFVRPPLIHSGPIHLASPDPVWPQQYAVVASRIREPLGPVAVLVEHVGSTSVPALAAKPILDVLLLVRNPANEAAYVPSLEAAGFLLHLREPDWHQHRLLKGHDPEVNLHVFPEGSEEAERMLLFRDRLRANGAERRRYEETKRRLAALDWNRVQDYADAKSEVVEAIIARTTNAQRTGVPAADHGPESSRLGRVDVADCVPDLLVDGVPVAADSSTPPSRRCTG